MKNEQIMKAIEEMNANINSRLESIEARLEALESKGKAKKSPKAEKPEEKVTRDQALTNKYGLNKTGRSAFIAAKTRFSNLLWKKVRDSKKQYEFRTMKAHIDKKATELATQWVDSQKEAHPEWAPGYNDETN